MNDSSLIYVLAPLFGWLVAHIIKFLIAFSKSHGKVHDWKIFFKAGGMPSSHTAVMIATVLVIGVRQGIGSAVFGLGVAITAIVIYDALNVRRSVGEQADLLRKVVAKHELDTKFYIAYGHNFTEVIVGAAVGIAVGLILLQIL